LLLLVTLLIDWLLRCWLFVSCPVGCLRCCYVGWLVLVVGCCCYVVLCCIVLC